MWVYLSEWIVGDGQFPAVAVDAVLDDVGIAFRGVVDETTTAPLVGTTGVEPIDGSGVPSRHHYQVSGIAGTAKDVEAADPRRGMERVHVGAEFLMTFDGIWCLVLARHRQAVDIAAGAEIRVRGTFSVMAEHEFEFGGPELDVLPRSWRVDRLQVERYRLIWHRGSEVDPWSGQPGHTLNTVDIDRIDIWPDTERYANHDPGSDESVGFVYALDLEPV